MGVGFEFWTRPARPPSGHPESHQPGNPDHRQRARTRRSRRARSTPSIPPTRTPAFKPVHLTVSPSSFRSWFRPQDTRTTHVPSKPPSHNVTACRADELPTAGARSRGLGPSLPPPMDNSATLPYRSGRPPFNPHTGCTFGAHHTQTPVPTCSFPAGCSVYGLLTAARFASPQPLWPKVMRGMQGRKNSRRLFA